MRVLPARLVSTAALTMLGLCAGCVSLPPISEVANDRSPPARLQPGLERSVQRVWIDTDAACTKAALVAEVDDCWALLYAMKSPHLDIVGISSVFGNKKLNTVNQTLGEFLAVVKASQGGAHRVPRVFHGAAEPLHSRDTKTSALTAMAEAAHDPLTIIALGPLTNVAMMLTHYPELASNIRIVAVGGQSNSKPLRANGGTFSFRDFNVWNDPEALKFVLAQRIPLTLIPFEVSTKIKFQAADLKRVASVDEATHWLARRSRVWLFIWEMTTEVDGFHPFDLLAVSYVAEPQLFTCESQRGQIVYQREGYRRPILLIAGQLARGVPLEYCSGVDQSAKERIMRVFTSRHDTENASH